MAVKSPRWVTMSRNHRNHMEVTFPFEVDKSNAKFRQVFWTRFFFKFIYFERNRESVSGGGAEREGKRESQTGSMFSTEPNAGLDLTNCEIMT